MLLNCVLYAIEKIKSILSELQRCQYKNILIAIARLSTMNLSVVIFPCWQRCISLLSFLFGDRLNCVY